MRHSTEEQQTAISDIGRSLVTAGAAPRVRTRGDEYDRLVEMLFKDTPFHFVLFSTLTNEDRVSEVVGEMARRLARRNVRVLAIDGSLETVIHSSTFAELDEMQFSFPGIFVAGDSHISAALMRLRGEYDFVLVDCGALESSPYVTALLPHSDGLVLTVKAGKTSRAQLASVLQALQNEGAKVIGLVMTEYRNVLPQWLKRLFS